MTWPIAASRCFSNSGSWSRTPALRPWSRRRPPAAALKPLWRCPAAASPMWPAAPEPGWNSRNSAPSAASSCRAASHLCCRSSSSCRNGCGRTRNGWRNSAGNNSRTEPMNRRCRNGSASWTANGRPCCRASAAASRRCSRPLTPLQCSSAPALGWSRSRPGWNGRSHGWRAAAMLCRRAGAPAPCGCCWRRDSTASTARWPSSERWRSGTAWRWKWPPGPASARWWWRTTASQPAPSSCSRAVAPAGSPSCRSTRSGPPVVVAGRHSPAAPDPVQGTLERA